VGLEALDRKVEAGLSDVRTAKAQGIYLLQRLISSSSQASIRHDGVEYVNMISNNYLGLSTHPEVVKAAEEALRKYGTGMCGSPLACGTTEVHRRLEKKIAQVFGMEDATLFSAGYQALLGTISAVIGPGDLALVDAKAHRSIIDGVKLSGGKLRAFLHNDMEDLSGQLDRLRAKHPTVIVLVDSVYSMEGDLAPLPELSRLAREYECILLLDEAHCVGMIGPRGYGLMDHFDLPGSAQLVSGTFSKFAGAVGGYTAGAADLVDFVRHVSSPFIFSAAVPPATAAGVLRAWELIDEEPERRERLLKNADLFRGTLLEAGLSAGGTTHVVPLTLGSPEAAITVNKIIFDQGILCSPIMPPLVPVNECGIRFGMMATHTTEQLERTLGIVIGACRHAGILGGSAPPGGPPP
jgi:8-amino-7-oxononanoate synthase